MYDGWFMMYKNPPTMPLPKMIVFPHVRMWFYRPMKFSCAECFESFSSGFGLLYAEIIGSGLIMKKFRKRAIDTPNKVA